MTDFDDMQSDDGDAELQRVIIGLAVRPPCLSSVELELTECYNLACDLVLFRMGADTQRVEFIEADEDEEVTPLVAAAARAIGCTPQSLVMEAEHLNAATKVWRDRIGLARSMGVRGCTWESFRGACAERGMTAGESSDQLRALLAPFWAAQEAAERQQRRKGHE